jgi:Fic family protein
MKIRIIFVFKLRIKMKSFKAGKYNNQGYYKSFQPNFINKQWHLEDMELIQLLSQADRHLGRLDMYSEYIPNIDLFINMHVVKEATQSSKIEGTQTNLEEALFDKEDVAQEKRDDWDEVHNYIEAMHQAIEMLETLPFSSRLIKETHKILLQGVRGEHKLPGEFRSSQNWIGGATLNDAVFVPPVHSSVAEFMGDLEKFANNEALFFPDLLKIALIHYQFETIHPFLDGNGRVGRLMITLFLVNNRILKKPILYLSDFFEKNRSLYYDNLTRVREKHDLRQWFKFFLVGVIETSKKGVDTFDKILKIQKASELKIQELGNRSQYALKLLHYLYQRPIIDAQRTSEITGQALTTSYRLLQDLEKLDILKELTGGKRGKLYSFHNYIVLFN